MGFSRGNAEKRSKIREKSKPEKTGRNLPAGNYRECRPFALQTAKDIYEDEAAVPLNKRSAKDVKKLPAGNPEPVYVPTGTKLKIYEISGRKYTGFRYHSSSRSRKINL